ncbi:MAG: peptide chain release factor N(5)-glutamine methyltransferase [Candidatus Omnitrophica bacterium]|nr:peptide chain release factor N(5)-glutamine methyltransferase [Candidatus Omnitrophota bacterium]
MTEHEQMLTSLLDCQRADLYLDPLELSERQREAFASMQTRRAQGEPLQYILGTADFMGLTLKVGPRVLIPRPETEILVEEALKVLNFSSGSLLGPRILDIGTGSGNIAIALAKNLPSAGIVSIDASQDALDLAFENARAHDVDAQIQFFLCPMEEYLNRSFPEDELFDMIISNPPYIRTSELSSLPRDVQQEPRMALDGGEEGLKYYQLIVEKAHQLLKNNGRMILEIGDGQKPAMVQLFQKTSQYTSIEFFNDYVGTPRIVLAQKI